MKHHGLKNNSKTLLFLSILLSWSPISSQDSFFQNFQSAKSYFNPSLVGLSGSTSINAKHRRQWGIGSSLFNSTYVSLEESLPCAFLDWGISGLKDVEGTAGFATTEMSASISGTIPFGNSNQVHNIRIGLSPRLSHKSIDLEALVFSDQLDPRFGAINPTSFNPNNADGRSLTFFSPAIGISMISTWMADTKKPITSSIGAAIYHTLALGDNLGGVESILKIDGGAAVPTRYTAFAEVEIITHSTNSFYTSVTPMVFYHQQASINYLEFGVSTAYNRDFSLGLYYHYSPKLDDRRSSNFYTIQADIAIIKTKNSRIDLGLGYSNTVTGLRNLLSDAFEVSFTYHFSKSFSCELMGFNGGNSSPSVRCPGAKFANMKRYEDLWYHSVGIGKTTK